MFAFNKTFEKNMRFVNQLNHLSQVVSHHRHALPLLTALSYVSLTGC